MYGRNWLPWPFGWLWCLVFALAYAYHPCPGVVAGPLTIGALDEAGIEGRGERIANDDPGESFADPGREGISNLQCGRFYVAFPCFRQVVWNDIPRSKRCWRQLQAGILDE